MDTINQSPKQENMKGFNFDNPDFQIDRQKQSSLLGAAPLALHKSESAEQGLKRRSEQLFNLNINMNQLQGDSSTRRTNNVYVKRQSAVTSGFGDPDDFDLNDLEEKGEDEQQNDEDRFKHLNLVGGEGEDEEEGFRNLNIRKERSSEVVINRDRSIKSNYKNPATNRPLRKLDTIIDAEEEHSQSEVSDDKFKP